MASSTSVLGHAVDISGSARDRGPRSLRNEQNELPRSASYTYLPLDPESNSDDPTNFPVKRTFSENVVPSPNGEEEGVVSSKKTSKKKSRRGISPFGRRKSSQADAQSKITISKFARSSGCPDGDTSYESKTTGKGQGVQPDPKSHSRPGSLSNFARKSWISASRSPSPSKTEEDGNIEDDDRSTLRSSISSTGRRKSFSIRNDSLSPPKDAPTGEGRGLVRRGTGLIRTSKRPLSAILKGSSTDAYSGTLPAVPSIPKSFSTDRLPSFGKSHPSSERLPPVPRSHSSERLHGFGLLDSPRKKDELWSAFRGLDGDFQKFQSKSSSLKANVVRMSLLPFLRNFAQHPSNKMLRPEDLDRRIIILNKWWTGLLELLNGRTNQSISGTDRPALLEAIAGIMERPEWRLPPSSFSPLKERSVKSSTQSRSSTSVESSASEFLAESVYHNVRNTYVQNLLAQMTLVIEKMSLRNAPASLVTFCGKACAYAFFFCPGVADVLVRLWSTSSSSMQRILEEYGIPRISDLKAVSETIVPGFPPCLSSLGFVSLASTVKTLRKGSPLPLGASNIPWYGPWVARWSGRDSDLFFVFVKHFHILLAEFLPSDAGMEEKICAPGFILVLAQMAEVLDSTIHRRNSQMPQEPSAGPSPITFEDVLAETDVSATTLPLPTSNATRSMAENRLIMLLRELLSDRYADLQMARETFADAFNIVLKASARRTSIFDHGACFTLCDFLEEAIGILERYERFSQPSHRAIDWSFWFDVFRHMTESQNMMTDIRLFAFLYSIWGLIASDEERKRELCIGWLLSGEVFEKYFNHWCPMVRAYYMRLLCWRLARVDGEGSALDTDIFVVLSGRLNSIWSYFLHLRAISESDKILAPSTAPCNPAPGRRFLIIRNDSQLAPRGMFLSFEGVVPPSAKKQPSAFEQHVSADQGSQEELENGSKAIAFGNGAGSAPASSQGRRRWGLLRNIMPFNSSNERSNSKQAGSVSLQSDISSQTSGSDNEGEKSSSNQTVTKAVSKGLSSSTKPQHYHQFRNFSFRFSLEWIESAPGAGKERRLYPPRLPMPAQNLLQLTQKEPDEIQPAQPTGRSVAFSRYAGKALAEWALVVIECQNFFERRKSEGVPENKWVETPSLGVESVRRH